MAHVNSTHATLVRESWARLASSRDASVRRFRRRLEAVSPRTAARFGCLDQRGSREDLLADLDRAIAATASDEELVPALARIARRFQEFGPPASEYPMVRDALLDVLSESSGGEAPAELRRAWGSLFGLLAALVDRAGRVTTGSHPAIQPSSHPAVAPSCRRAAEEE